MGQSITRNAMDCLKLWKQRETSTVVNAGPTLINHNMPPFCLAYGTVFWGAGGRGRKLIGGHERGL